MNTIQTKRTKDDFAQSIDGFFNRKAPPVRVPSFILVIAFKLHVLQAIGWHFLAKRNGVHIHTTLTENVAELDASPLGRAHGANDPVRSNENFVVLVVQVLAAVAGTLKRRDDFVFGKLCFEIVQCEFVLFDSFSRNNESVFVSGNIRNGKMAACVKELVWCKVVVCEQLDSGFSVWIGLCVVWCGVVW